LPGKNDVTNPTNTSPIGSLSIFYVSMQIQPDSCVLHGADALPQDPPPTDGPCATSGAPASHVADSMDQVSTPHDVAILPSAPVPNIDDVGPASS
jgi:hypothetical protein